MKGNILWPYFVNHKAADAVRRRLTLLKTLPFTLLSFALLPFALYPLPFCPLPFTLNPLPFTLNPLPFTLNPLPFALCPPALSSDPHQVCAGARVSYWVDSAGNAGSTYVWAIDGSVVQRGANCLFFHTWDSPGTYDLTLQQFSVSGCRGDLRSVRVSVTQDTNPGLAVRVFPNPLTSPDLMFRIDTPAGSPLTIDLYESNGQLIAGIYEGQLPGRESATITYRHNLPQGIYLYRVRSGNRMISGRIVVIRTF